MKSPRLALFAALLFAAGSVTVRAQAPQQPGDLTKADSNSIKKAKKPKQTETAAQTPPETPSASPATASNPATPATTPGSGTPASKPATAQQPRAATGGVVWVNTDSGIYHKPGTRWYGKTKHGKYMTEADAKKAGYRAAVKE